MKIATMWQPLQSEWFSAEARKKYEWNPLTFCICESARNATKIQVASTMNKQGHCRNIGQSIFCMYRENRDENSFIKCIRWHMQSFKTGSEIRKMCQSSVCIHSCRVWICEWLWLSSGNIEWTHDVNEFSFIRFGIRVSVVIFPRSHQWISLRRTNCIIFGCFQCEWNYLGSLQKLLWTCQNARGNGEWRTNLDWPAICNTMQYQMVEKKWMESVEAWNVGILFWFIHFIYERNSNK